MKVCELLMRRGASLDIADSNQVTALMLASMHGHSSVVSCLLLQKAAIENLDSHGRNAFHLSCASLDVSIVRMFVNQMPSIVKSRDGCGRNGLFYASMNTTEISKVQIIEYLLDCDCDPNQTDNLGNRVVICPDVAHLVRTRRLALLQQKPGISLATKEQRPNIEESKREPQVIKDSLVEDNVIGSRPVCTYTSNGQLAGNGAPVEPQGLAEASSTGSVAASRADLLIDLRCEIANVAQMHAEGEDYEISNAQAHNINTESEERAIITCRVLGTMPLNDTPEVKTTPLESADQDLQPETCLFVTSEHEAIGTSGVGSCQIAGSRTSEERDAEVPNTVDEKGATEDVKATMTNNGECEFPTEALHCTVTNTALSPEKTCASRKEILEALKLDLAVSLASPLDDARVEPEAEPPKAWCAKVIAREELLQELRCEIADARNKWESSTL